MAWRPRTLTLCGSLLVGVGTFAVQAQTGQSLVTPQTSSVSHPPELFVGLWAYNQTESVNAATGRPEQAPRSATQRAAAARAGGSGLGGGAVSTRPSQPVGRSAGLSNSPGDIGPTVAMIQENRSLRRDLLEVPEELTIRITPGAVTFKDDLSRERTYPTNGQRQRLQIGAARFNAATTWAGSQLEKHIDAADGFRMTEVYFLSPDARRLFVIVRVGSSRKGAPVMGVNRVYDRVDQ